MAAKARPMRVHERNVRSLAWWSRSCEPVLATGFERSDLKWRARDAILLTYLVNVAGVDVQVVSWKRTR